MTAAAEYPFPPLLAQIPRDRSAAIEASAGTGKTHLIEHLVVDRLIHGDARLDQILVVTFTERAAAELVRRIRALVGNVLAGRAPPDAAADAPRWAIDDLARRRLADAERGLDVAPISTIHAFCRGVLDEYAFAGGRLLTQETVESRTAHARAFADVARTRLATDPELSPYLDAWLMVGSADGLEALLYRARQHRYPWAATFDAERVSRAARALAEIPLATVEATVRMAIKHAGSANGVMRRLRVLHRATEVLAAPEQALTLLAHVDELVRSADDVFNWAEDRLGSGRAIPAVAGLLDRLGELADAAVPLATAVAQKLGPVVEQRLRDRKRAAGQHDFDDLLSMLAEALRGPGGGELAAALRGRFKLAIIDEFQDTDPIQWEIFRSIFKDSGGANPLYLIGDPKQSIYGFRGADVATYAAARAEVAPADETLRLSLNYRSTQPVIDTHNAILDAQASPCFFSAGIDYQPVSRGARDAGPEPAGAPAVLLRVSADNEERLPMRVVRATLADAIAGEIARLLAETDGPPAREIFVLTRTRRESEAIAGALARRFVPHVLYNQEGLYETAEARHVRDLLRAIEDPHDPAKRLRAWLTPFIGLALAELPAALAGGDQALVDRLTEWHAAAQLGDAGHVLARVLDQSGVVRRELFTGEAMRRLTNLQQLGELLGAQPDLHGQPLAEVVRRLSSLVAKLVIPSPAEGNQLRVEGDRDAVQVMTVHRAKGLEADYVFLYGGFGPGPRDEVLTYSVGAGRARLAGRPRRAAIVDLVKRERNGDDERLYYVALTRARRRLYLPFSGNVPESDASFDSVEREELWKLTGGYRHVNSRLKALVKDPAARRLFDKHDVAISALDPDPVRPSAAAVADWRPAPAELAAVVPDPALAGLRRARAGTITTSYSRIKQAHGGFRPPTEIPDEPVAGAPEEVVALPRADVLPGGTRIGVFLHELLEKLDLDVVRASPAADEWAARPEVAELGEALLRKHGREPRLAAAALGLAYATLTTPLTVDGRELPGIARAARVARELEFLFPFPDAAGGADRGFVKGYIDVIFEHDGRSYFGDWKTDQLPSWDVATVKAHVEANYAVQEKLYALALSRMLGIDDEATHEARFGGTLYVFVRGLADHPSAAVLGRRPSFADIQRWRAEIGDALMEAAEPASEHAS